MRVFQMDTVNTIVNRSIMFEENNMSILNLTQHAASPEQIAVGVVDLAGHELEMLKELLTFNVLPSKQDITARAVAVASLAKDRLGVKSAMIGGAPFFMAALEAALVDTGVTPLYAFSTRVSEDQVQPDGSVRKIAVFKHLGFVGL